MNGAAEAKDVEPAKHLDALVAAGMVTPSDLALFSFAETAEAVWAELVARGLQPGAEPPWDAARDIHQ